MTASNRNLVTGFLILFLVTLFPVPVLSQDSPEPVNQHYKQGINLFEEGQYRKAAAELERFGELHPNHELLPSAWYYRARALGYADSTNRRAHYESFIRSYPNTIFSQKLLFELGQSAEQAGNHRGAISYYERSLSHKLKPAKAAEVYFWMAEAAVSAGDTDQARHYFLTLADRYPESPWAPKALYSRGRLYLNEGQFDASSKAFELLKERYPNHDMTRRIGTALGESYYQQRKFPEAIEAFKNAMPYLDEELSAKATYLIAESYNYLNQFDEASRYYLQYINMKKGSERVRIAHYGLGWVYHKQEIYHWAAESFGKAAGGEDELARKALYYKAVNEKLGGRYADAIETFREFGNRYREGLWIEQAYYEWAVTAYEMGIYEESVEVLLDLVRMEQKLQWEGNVYTLLGEAYFASKEYTRALQAFEEAEKLTDIDPEVKRQARFHKAWMQHQNQAYRQAQPVFESIYDEAPDSELGKKALFWSADAHYNLRQYGPASRQFDEFVERYSGHELTGAAHYSLGWSYFNLGDYANAIEPFETFLNNYEAPSIALYPYDTDTQLRLGDSYYAMGRYDEAIGAYEMAIGAEPGGDYAMFQIANCHYRDEETYEAVTTFRRFLRIYPFSRLREQAQYNIAYIYLNTGNYTQAIEEFQKVINKYPNTNWAARSQYNIGDAYYNAGEYDRAVSAYNAVLQKYPSSSYIIEAVNGIQYAQLSAGEADSSSAILEEFLADHPRTSMADRLRFRKAEDLMQSGDYMSAIDAFRQYIRISNNQQLLSDAWFNLANAYEQTQKMSSAIDAYRTVVDSYPESERAAASLAALGRIAYQNGRYEESYDYFSKLAEGAPRFRLEAFIGMADARLSTGDVDEAEELYKKALSLNSDYDPAKLGLGRVALGRGNFAGAEDRFSLIAERNTTAIGAEAQYLLGVTRQRQQQFEEALKAYADVKILYEAFDNWVAKALLKSAECYIQLGNKGEARNTLNSIIENYPGTYEAKQARQMLQS